MTEQVSNNLSREYLNEAIYPDPGSFLPVLETEAPQRNPNDTVAAISALQPPISHIPTTSTVSVLGDSHIQPSAPGSTVPITVPENVIPQAHEPVTETICTPAPVHPPELSQSNIAHYDLEVRPFDLQRPSGVDNYQLGREFGEFDELTEDILNCDYLF
jgi:hypothetical protein